MNGLTKVLATAALLTVASCQFDTTEPPLGCTELKPGIEVTGDIGGSARTQAALQVASDVNAIVSVSIFELAGACRRIAEANGVSGSDLAKADAMTPASARADAICKLAGPTLHGPAPAPATCTQSTFDRSDCLLGCASCDVVCDMNARAKAKCIGPDQSDLSAIAAVKGRLESIAEAGAPYSAALTQFNDYKHICISFLTSQTTTALEDAALAEQTADELLAHVQ